MHELSLLVVLSTNVVRIVGILVLGTNSVNNLHVSAEYKCSVVSVLVLGINVV